MKILKDALRPFILILALLYWGILWIVEHNRTIIISFIILGLLYFGIRGKFYDLSGHVPLDQLIYVVAIFVIGGLIIRMAYTQLHKRY